MFALARMLRGSGLITGARSTGERGRQRRSRRGPHTRKQILDAALRLFSERGFARTSVRDIAEAAGITDAAIYYHFASKRDLFEALFEERGITSVLSQLEQATVTMPPLEVFKGLAVVALDVLHRNRDFMKVIFSGAISEDPLASEEYRLVTERWRNGQARLLRDYVQRGDLPAIDVDVTARQLVVLAIGPFTDALMSGQADDGEGPSPELVARVQSGVELFVRGLLG